MTNIINTTPHAVRFVNADGTEFEVPPCGTVISARGVDEPAGQHPSGASLVWVRFEATEEAVAAIDRLEAENPGAVILGSIIAAQAFPGRVFAMVAAPGYERVPPAEKRFRPDRFTTFG